MANLEFAAIERGDVLEMKTLRVQSGDAEFGFKVSNKGSRFVCLFLGVKNADEDIDPEKILNEMGWYQGTESGDQNE